MNVSSVPVSAYVICFNEADKIAACLESLSFCRDIIIVDSGSTDATLKIVAEFQAKGLPVRVFDRKWPGFAAQKQFALEQCAEEWCLGIDSDERVDKTLAHEIAAIATENRDDKIAAWTVRRRDWINGYGYAHRWVVHQDIARLTRRGLASYTPDRAVHESLFVDGAIGRIAGGWLLHDRKMSLREEIEKLATYTNLKVQDRMRSGKRPRLYKLLLSPTLAFLKMYILKRYFLCGIPGLIYAGVIAQYTFATEAGHYLAARGDTTS